MALKGLKVLEFAGLAPGPFCGKILADFGAIVTRIDKNAENNLEVLQHGKRTLAVDLKHAQGQQLVQRLARDHDVLIEPFRPGVMESLNLGPAVLCAQQPRLIYARLTGFGQSGRLAKRAGHDINYVALSGVLSMLGRRGAPPQVPINVIADFAGGGLMCALGICLALLERHRSGRGQIVDAAMVDGAAYVASWLFMSRTLPIWRQDGSQAAGGNVLDGGAFYYDTYATKDGKFMSVGALEGQFFQIFKECLGLPHLQQHLPESNEGEASAARDEVREAFLRKTQAEWSQIFEDVDACVYPVVEWSQVLQHDHNRDRQSFECDEEGNFIPKPAPRLSRTPGHVGRNRETGEARAETLAILREELQIGENEIEELVANRVIRLPGGPGAKL